MVSSPARLREPGQRRATISRTGTSLRPARLGLSRRTGEHDGHAERGSRLSRRSPCAAGSVGPSAWAASTKTGSLRVTSAWMRGVGAHSAHAANGALGHVERDHRGVGQVPRAIACRGRGDDSHPRGWSPNQCSRRRRRRDRSSAGTDARAGRTVSGSRGQRPPAPDRASPRPSAAPAGHAPASGCKGR